MIRALLALLSIAAFGARGGWTVDGTSDAHD